MMHDRNPDPSSPTAENAGELPEILPIFPLTGSLLLPGGLLPLHVFEPRYCQMVEDALAAEGEGRIGMVQPVVPDPGDQRGPDGDDEERAAPKVYPVGCAGALEQVQRLPYDRYLVLLRGRERFRIREELEPTRGYRRVRVTYDEFGVDAVDREADLAAEPLLDALRGFGQTRGFELDVSQLEKLSGLALLNGLAMNLPFAPAEKQALLEAANLAERREMLLALLSMGFDGLTVDPAGDSFELAN